ncbi:hypothetical protein R77592_04516 [Ralstonia mannitolilytica]|nr:hypothetical protein R77592_04516 [Ralstonia mannitolilytica]
MYAGAFSRAETIAKEMSAAKADVVIIAFGDEIFGELQKRARELNKPVELVKRAQSRFQWKRFMSDGEHGAKGDGVDA